MRIHVLPDSLVNLIAAGEVIERPASVVKELVENAVDAGATRIEISVKGGGIDEIVVRDNGHGMEQEELALAFTRHATSKIAAKADLYNIRTLGFRGEALPSIAAVAKVEVLTASREGEGSRISIAGGQVVDVSPWPSPVGTQVKVSDLFFNTPARRKFLKSKVTEANHVYETVTRLALSRPEISFSLAHEKRQVFKTPGNNRLEDTVAAVLGIDYLEKMVKVEKLEGDIGLWGLVSRPDFTRSNRRDQILIVNQRVVRSPLLFRALDEAYRGLLLGKEFPAAVLFIQVPPNAVDVNVHPQKAEVKFADEKGIFDLVRQAVRLALTRHDLPRGESCFGSGLSESKVAELGSRYAAQSTNLVQMEHLLPPTDESDVFSFADKTQVLPSGYTVLGQWLRTYIIVSAGEELWLVDQHAAHERVLYDRMRKDQTPENTQPLVIPVSLSLPASKMEVLENNLETLRGYGFNLDVLGYNSVVIRSVPSSVSGREAEALDRVLEVLAEGRTEDGSLGEKVWTALACKGAIKAGTCLAPEEMSRLLTDWLSCDDYHHCPHGRPTFTVLTVKEVEKKLKRM